MAVKDPNRKVIVMQWLVIAALVMGSGVAVWMLMNKTDDYKNQATQQQGNVDSLREQLHQAKNPTPTPGMPLPEASTNVSPSPSASPSASPSNAPR